MRAFSVCKHYAAGRFHDPTSAANAAANAAPNAAANAYANEAHASNAPHAGKASALKFDSLEAMGYPGALVSPRVAGLRRRVLLVAAVARGQ